MKKIKVLRIVFSLGLLAAFPACSSDGMVGDDGVDAGLTADADPLAPDADPFAPDADPLAPDAHPMPPDAANTPDAAVMPPDATVGPADAGFTPWASWDGIYSMEWVQIANTCVLSAGLPNWNYVRLYNTATPAGMAFYEQLFDVYTASEAPAHVIGPGAMTIDSYTTISSCMALQISATTFQCDISRHATADPGGPCDTTWQVTSTFIAL